VNDLKAAVSHFTSELWTAIQVLDKATEKGGSAT
jgi:hypothetical protein